MSTTPLPQPLAAVRPTVERGFAGLGRRLDDAARRAVDIAAAVFGLLILAPWFLLLAWRIRRDSPGPVLYLGPRVGRHGRLFRIVKFRTMYDGPDSEAGPRLTACDDPRTTPLGRWLRATKLNELPQLWNVLVGEMSLVGPRPEDPAIAVNWLPEVRHALLAVRPGITSPASILYRDEEDQLRTHTAMDEYLRSILPSKLRLDLLYVRDRTLLNDLDVLLWTVAALLPGLRHATVREHQLFWGPLAVAVNRYFSWLLVDTAVALVVVPLAVLLWGAAGPLRYGVGLAAALSVGMAVLFSLVNALLGLQRVAWARAHAFEAVELGVSAGLSTLALMFLGRLWPGQAPLPAGMLMLAGALALLGFVAVRYRSRLVVGAIARWLRLRGTLARHGERVLVIGAGDTGNCALCVLKRPELASLVTVTGVVDDDPRKQGLRFNGATVLGQTADIPRLVAQHDVGVLVFALANVSAADRERIRRVCAAAPARVIEFANLRGDVQQQLRGAPSPVGPGVVRAWLQELDELARAEEWPACRQRIAEFKAKVEGNAHACPLV